MVKLKNLIEKFEHDLAIHLSFTYVVLSFLRDTDILDISIANRQKRTWKKKKGNSHTSFLMKVVRLIITKVKIIFAQRSFQVLGSGNSPSYSPANSLAQYAFSFPFATSYRALDPAKLEYCQSGR